MHRALALSLTLGALAVYTCGADDGVVVRVSKARTDGDGFQVHEVQSPYQAGTTRIRVLLPNPITNGQKLPVVYVLPVEAGTESRYGDGLKEAQQRNLHQTYGVVFVAPTFAQLPWYADHPTRPEVRQERHFLDVVIPFIERTYPVQAEARGRRLLGFSKSGWGAWSLLLRHPDQFENAAAWDAPLMMDKPGPYGSGAIFGSPENFANYQIAQLLKAKAEQFQHPQRKRLILLGYGNFRADHQQTHALLDKLLIAHDYSDGPALPHHWHSGWAQPAVDRLMMGK